MERRIVAPLYRFLNAVVFALLHSVWSIPADICNDQLPRGHTATRRWPRETGEMPSFRNFRHRRRAVPGCRHRGSRIVFTVGTRAVAWTNRNAGPTVRNTWRTGRRNYHSSAGTTGRYSADSTFGVWTSGSDTRSLVTSSQQ